MKRVMEQKIRDERRYLRSILKEDKREKDEILYKHGRRNKGYRAEIRERNRVICKQRTETKISE